MTNFIAQCHTRNTFHFALLDLLDQYPLLPMSLHVIADWIHLKYIICGRFKKIWDLLQSKWIFFPVCNFEHHLTYIDVSLKWFLFEIKKLEVSWLCRPFTGCRSLLLKLTPILFVTLSSLLDNLSKLFPLSLFLTCESWNSLARAKKLTKSCLASC